MAQLLAHEAYRHIRKRLLDGSFSPGLRLDYRQLGQEIGVSATPVREAIGKLASEGLIELVPHLGAVVRRFAPAEIAELYEIRELMEAHAARQAARAMRAPDLEHLRARIEQMRQLEKDLEASKQAALVDGPLERFFECDVDFHMTIISSVNNRWLLKFMGESQIFVRIFSANCAVHDVPLIRETIDFHQQILDALGAGDSDRAGDISARHVRRGREIVLAHHARQALEQASWAGPRS